MTDLFLITSVINVGNHPWSYTNTRSVFSMEERFQQTLQTIYSIRQHYPSCRILLCECSDLTDEYTIQLKESVEYYIQAYHDELMRSKCLFSYKKGQGEAHLTMYAIRYMKEHNIVFRRLYKISGRYTITEKFKESMYSDSTFTFRHPYPGTTAIPTFLYSVPYIQFMAYETVIQKCIEHYEESNTGYEELFPVLCEPKCFIDALGVTGRIAVDNYFIEG